MSGICLTIEGHMGKPNELLIMVLDGLIQDSDEQSLEDKNQVTALKLEIITWLEFLEYWRNRKTSALSPNHETPKKAA